MTKQCLVGFNPREVFIVGNEHRQKHNPIWGQVVYLLVVLLEEILDEPMDGHPESVAKEVNEDYNLTKIRGGHVLAKGTLVTRKLPWCQESPNHKC
jgi:hypothetical protein